MRLRDPEFVKVAQYVSGGNEFLTSTNLFKSLSSWGACTPQLVRPSALARVVISRFVSSSLMLGSGLTAQSLEAASDSVSPSLPLPCSHSVFLSQK